MERLKDVEACRDIADIWFEKGKKALSDALNNQILPNWNKFFDKLWEEFTTFKLKCTECGQITPFNIDFSRFDIDFYANFDIDKYLKGIESLMCFGCYKFQDVNIWEKV